MKATLFMPRLGDGFPRWKNSEFRRRVHRSVCVRPAIPLCSEGVDINGQEPKRDEHVYSSSGSFDVVGPRRVLPGLSCLAGERIESGWAELPGRERGRIQNRPRP